MALPSSGEITINDIRTELGETTGSLRSLSATAGFTSPDAMSEFYGYSAATIEPTDHFNVSTWTGNGVTQGIDSKLGKQAASFDGSSSYVDLPNSLTTGLTDAGSISLWVNCDDANNDGHSPISLMDTIWVNIFLGQNVTNGVYARLVDSSASSRIVEGSGTLNDNSWNHIVFTWDDTAGQVQLYLNNVSQGTTSWNGTNYDRNNDNVLGQYGQIGVGRYYEGKLDNVRIYSKALSSSEVSTLYNETDSSTISISNLHAHYKLDGNGTDETGNFDGTLYNMSWIGMNFQPDFVWIKDQEDGSIHVLFDSLRGSTKYLVSSSDAGEATGATTLTSFDSRGFTVGNSGAVNQDGSLNVAWSWKGGGTGVSNTNGDITSTVSANQTAGFSIVEFTASGTGTDTVGHGLSTTPDVVLMKRTNTLSDWYFFTTAIDGSMDLMDLNNTSAQAANANQAFTSTTFRSWASSGEWIVYCFHSVNNYQRFTTYTGNGSFTGPTVYLDSNGDNTGTGGFKPRWVMIKRTDSTGNWVILDHLRKDGSAGNNSASDPDLISDFLEPNTNDARTTGAFERIKLLSNGFQVVNTAGYLNDSGGEYLAWAIA